MRGSHRKKIVFGIILLFLLYAPVSFGESFTLTVLHTNDIHGHVTEPGGYARIATLVSGVRKENPNTLVLDAGDLFSGTPISAYYQGRAEILGALLVGYDALVIGNHEFDFGLEVLRSYVNHLPLPFLGANIKYESGASFAPTHIIKTFNSTRFLIIGLSYPKTPISTHPNNVRGLMFLDPAQTMEDILQMERGNYDNIIVLSHLGFKEDQELARAVPEIDLIVGGHSHTEVTSPFYTGSTLIAQAGDKGRYLGRIDLTITDGSIEEATAKLIPVTDVVPANPVIQTVLDDLFEVIDNAMHNPIGHLPFGLSRAATGVLIADAMLWASKADLAVYNSGGIRSELPSGEITAADIFAVEPFGNFLVTTEISTEQMKLLFEHLAARSSDPLAGASYAINAGEVEDILIQGVPLGAKPYYTVATSDFLVAGGSGFTMLSGKNQSTIAPIRELLLEYLTRN